MLTIVALLLATAFPSASKTSWMSPQSFRLTIGMPRVEAVGVLESGGWGIKKGRNDDEIIIDYSEGRAMTLDFRGDRLRSVRFELFATLPEVRAAFDEQKSVLRKEHGEPKKQARNHPIIVYDDRLPNIMVVLSDDPQSDYGKKGVGYLAVRYYDPVASAIRPHRP
ncbi:MAG TPA: hypothetical protein VM779_03325 [Thermoanaerobaculia bacterium]|nr:hypothetical protein [Thermoanaerobaculia bacterium]